MKYIVKTVNEVNWGCAEKIKIAVNKWNSEYVPETYAQLVCVKGEGLALKMTCAERSPRAVYKNFFDDVYKDSCMEFFFSFEREGNYINCEMNSNGASLIAAGKNRYNRVRIDKLITPPVINAVVDADVWTVETYFPLKDLKTVIGDFVSLEKGVVFYGNFYKCGDDTASPHYIMWSPVELEKPDFHQSEFFGELIIE